MAYCIARHSNSIVPDYLEFRRIPPNPFVAHDVSGEHDFITDLKFLARDRDVVCLASVEDDIDSGPHLISTRGPYDDVVHDFHAPIETLNGDI